ncbi:MAG: hypothetical protein M1416_00805 [Candidatus Pacearchaeota archaeon]|nr:hypothetical protein [Candidatus Pacearchaeota archaeon]
MLKNQKYVFLYALILTLVVFNLGIFMGYMMESSRIEKINTLYIEAEMELLDQIAQKDAMETLSLNCDILVEENINFGDKIFEEALQIQKYEEANRINNDIIFQHKRFDLLRALFWINSIKIGQKCHPDYHNFVYFYQYNNPSIEQESEQKFFSNLLREFKEEKGSGIMLIPIAADNDIPSINLLTNKYNITELPVILIDEKIKITEINSREDIEKYLD